MDYQWKSYSDYVDFVKLSVKRWGWQWKDRCSDREKAVKEELLWCISIMAQTYTDVDTLANELKKQFGFQIPIVWNAPAEGYFDNWSKLWKGWNLLSERPLH